jgi:hypothetical protein
MRKFSTVLLIVSFLFLGSERMLAAPRTAEVAQKVYAQFSALPRNEVPGEPDNTLIRRMIQYHTRVQGRPEQSRLDWQLTFSDYLGYNLNIDPTTYPDRNALEADKAAIDKLTRDQRNQLIRLFILALQP